MLAALTCAGTSFGGVIRCWLLVSRRKDLHMEPAGEILEEAASKSLIPAASGVTYLLTQTFNPPRLKRWHHQKSRVLISSYSSRTMMRNPFNSQWKVLKVYGIFFGRRIARCSRLLTQTCTSECQARSMLETLTEHSIDIKLLSSYCSSLASLPST